MIDFGLDPITGDLDLSTGDIKLVTAKRSVAQNIGTRLRFQKGSWFLDTRVGIPLYPDILGVKGGRVEDVKSIIANAITSCYGVRRLVSLDLDLDANRNLLVTFQVESDEGEFVTGTETLIPEEGE